MASWIQLNIKSAKSLLDKERGPEQKDAETLRWAANTIKPIIWIQLEIKSLDESREPDESLIAKFLLLRNDRYLKCIKKNWIEKGWFGLNLSKLIVTIIPEWLGFDTRFLSGSQLAIKIINIKKNLVLSICLNVLPFFAQKSTVRKSFVQLVSS